jgi:phosphonate transport system substrate-binding protein
MLSVFALAGCPGKLKGAAVDNVKTTTGGNAQEDQGRSSVSGPEGSVRIAFVPSVEAGQIESQLGDFDTRLSGILGHKVESDVVLSYTAAVEQMAAGHFDAAFIPPLAYILANDRYDARVILKAVRNGKPTYRGEIIARADSGINTLDDLKGKSFGFVEASSTSGHLYPKTLLINSGINPDTDLKAIFVGSHPAVVEAVLSGRIAAGACFDDARQNLLTTEPNVMTDIKVIAYTPAIPGDTVTFRKDCTGPFYDKLADALMQLSKDGKEGTLYKIYQIEELIPAQDTDYDPIRQMVKTLGIDVEMELSKPK